MYIDFIKKAEIASAEAAPAISAVWKTSTFTN